jgi:hypothetical protein
MKPKTAARLAGSIGVLAVAMFSATVVFVISRPSQLPAGIEPQDPLDLLGSAAFLVFVGLGVLIAARRSENPIGWMFIAAGSMVLFAGFAWEYALYALYTNPGPLPAGAVMAWASSWSWVIGAGLIILAILVFPNGRLATRRWRPLAWFIVADIVVMSLGGGISVWPDRGLALLTDFQDETVSPVGERIFLIGFSLLLLSLLPVAASILLRFRRARGDERQQLKWVAYGTGVLVATTLFSEWISHILGISHGSAAFVLVDTLGIMAIPIATGVAVLKYRLYDIDVIVHRTLVYGALTGLSALVYLAGVVGVGGLVRDVTGSESSDVVVAGSTLAVAALFRPARSRIQAFIDRRFFRRKYNAARTLDGFTTTLRDEVDLDEMTSDLLKVVNETMQPTHLSLWLRQTAPR